MENKWIYLMGATILQLTIIVIVSDMAWFQAFLCGIVLLVNTILVAIVCTPETSGLISADVMLQEGIQVQDAANHIKKIESTFTVCLYCGSHKYNGHLRSCRIAAALECLGMPVNINK